MKNSESLMIAKEYLGKEIFVKIDRPLDSTHPKHGFKYLVNYGFVPNTSAPDGEELDAYVLGVSEPLKEFTGDCIALIHREDDDDDKLIVVPKGESLSDDEISKEVHFQEQWFKSSVVRT